MRRMLTLFALTFLLVAATAATAFATPALPSGPGRVILNHSVRIWYEVRGHASGRPLVLVNGGPGFDHNYELCSDAWDVIARTRPVVMWDQRGNGRSGALAKGTSCTLVDQIADLEAIRVALGQERIDLIGHSWGGYLVMAYASRYPQHVAHLIICDSAAPKWTDTEFIFKYIYPESMERQAVMDGRDALGDSAAAAASLHEYLGWLFVSTEKRDAFLAGSAEYHYSRAINEALNADLEKRDLWPLLPGLTMPTLVITGHFDINVAPSTVEGFLAKP